MTPLSIFDFAAVVKGEVFGVSPRQLGATSGDDHEPQGQDPAIKGFALDNREVKPGDLFVAIKGERVDGHDFALSAIKAGAIAVLSERPINGPYILVPNVVRALADFAAGVRGRFRGPVIAVTGSAGKTTTKELVAAALGPLGSVLKTEGNRNSEFTSPLLWAELTPRHRAAVVEMGMRGFNQVAHLASFTKPTIGVVTNIGVSHMEMVGNREGIAQAKSELLAALPRDGNAVLWAEDPFADFMARLSTAPVKTFGFSQSADCRIIEYEPINWRSSVISGLYRGIEFKASLPSVGRHIALNAAAAILAAALAGVPADAAANALRLAEFPPMRMEVLEVSGATIVLDAYNASPASVVAALETLRDLPATGRRIAVLGEMKELGSYAEEGHREVGTTLPRCGVDLVVLLGEPTRWIGSAAQSCGMESGAIKYVESVEEISAFLRGVREGDVVLIKGSRALELERALEGIQPASSGVRR